jgi:hypothetical protein
MYPNPSSPAKIQCAPAKRARPGPSLPLSVLLLSGRDQADPLPSASPKLSAVGSWKVRGILGDSVTVYVGQWNYSFLYVYKEDLFGCVLRTLGCFLHQYLVQIPSLSSFRMNIRICNSYI